MNKSMNLLNASMLQLRAKAVKAAATIEAILDSTSAGNVSDYVDEIVTQSRILAENDAAIKLLQSNFVSPIAEQRRAERVEQGNVAPLPPELQEKLDALQRTPPAETAVGSDPYPVKKPKASSATKRHRKS